MLHDFLTDNRSQLIERCRSISVERPVAAATQYELEHGIPLFLDLVIKTLEIEQTTSPQRSREVSGHAGGLTGISESEIGTASTQYGRELSEHGFTLDQVVHSYGDLCQAITGLAYDEKAPISVDEFRTLNRCLDNGIAGAVTAFSGHHDGEASAKNADALNERLGFLTHELRNLIHTTTLAVTAIKAGNVGFAGATGAVLDRSLEGLRRLVNRSLAEVRVSAGMLRVQERIVLADLIAEIKSAAALEARARGCRLSVAEVDRTLVIEGDREMLFSAISNLLQNAFKFTKRQTEVSLIAYATTDRVLIDIKDHCGGLPSGAAKNMFQPFAQNGEDRSGLGLGLSIARRSVEANEGVLRVRDVPGSGCVFTIDLPKISQTQAA